MSDSDLVDFEDLELLDSSDLRAVFGVLTQERMLDALVGTRPGFRQLLLGKLPPRLVERLDSHGPVSVEAALSAQREVVEALCRLSRGGIIAFDHPADMVA